MVGYRTRFEDYFKENFVPYFQQKDASVTEEKLKKMLTLTNIEDYLRNAKKIGLMHNEDDIIMEPGEVAYLEELFGPRAKIFPTGGHCGNMNHQDAVKFIVSFFAGQEG